MKRLYNHTKGKIHPPPPSTTTHLSLLPLAIATLAAALSPEDQETLAYLLSSSTTAAKPTSKPTTKSDHPPQFNCKCFQCYTSFWVRWDASPNRKKIYEIIDAYEYGLIHTKKSNKSKKERKHMKGLASSGLNISHDPPCDVKLREREPNAPSESDQKRGDFEEEVVSEKGSVRKIVGFIGERIWGVWGI